MTVHPRAARTPLQTLRWPLAALGLSLALVLAGFVLDQFPGTGRDLALVIGGPALTVLLPLSAIWLVIALVLQHRRSRRR
jgi:Na+/melibiose symporter-like transporter